MTTSIADEKYVLLKTIRKNGTEVPSPVWIARLDGDRAGFTTDADSGKVKRIRNNPQVTLQACSMKGAPREGAPIVTATAEVLLGAEAVAVRQAINSKYRVMATMMRVGSFFGRLIKRGQQPDCAIRVTLNS